MPNQEDYLDRVWIKVINLDPNGAWIQECLEQSAEAGFRDLGPALERIISLKPSREDLGRLYRFVRYQACSAGFRALEKPGLKQGKVRGLHRQLAASKQAKGGKNLPEPGFLGSLWTIIDADDHGAWMKMLGRTMPLDGAFGDVPPALGRLLKKKIKEADLEAVARWHRYDAIYQLLRLMDEEGFQRAAEIPGLHEILLGLEPSGKEARAGSWPFLRKLG